MISQFYLLASWMASGEGGRAYNTSNILGKYLVKINFTRSKIHLYSHSLPRILLHANSEKEAGAKSAIRLPKNKI